MVLCHGGVLQPGLPEDALEGGRAQAGVRGAGSGAVRGGAGLREWVQHVPLVCPLSSFCGVLEKQQRAMSLLIRYM